MFALIFSPIGRYLAGVALLAALLLGAYGKGRLDQSRRDNLASHIALIANLRAQAANAALINKTLAEEKAKAELEREATDKRRQELESALDSVKDLDCVDADTARRLRNL